MLGYQVQSQKLPDDSNKQKEWINIYVGEEYIPEQVGKFLNPGVSNDIFFISDHILT